MKGIGSTNLYAIADSEQGHNSFYCSRWRGALVAMQGWLRSRTTSINSIRGWTRVLTSGAGAVAVLSKEGRWLRGCQGRRSAHPGDCGRWRNFPSNGNGRYQRRTTQNSLTQLWKTTNKSSTVVGPESHRCWLSKPIVNILLFPLCRLNCYGEDSDIRRDLQCKAMWPNQKQSPHLTGQEHAAHTWKLDRQLEQWRWPMGFAIRSLECSKIEKLALITLLGIAPLLDPKLRLKSIPSAGEFKTKFELRILRRISPRVQKIQRWSMFQHGEH